MVLLPTIKQLVYGTLNARYFINIISLNFHKNLMR